MKLLSQSVVAVLLLAVAGISQATEVVRVNSMNYPAWLVRDHQTLPLQPGAELRGEDLVRTGDGGRVLIQMADGSSVKLGESARFVVQTAAMRDDQGESFLESTFQVLRGAFRFTSGFFGNTNTGHRVSVRIGAITAGVRGTDIWGRSNLEQDLVCLIEGAIAVDSPGEETVNMSDPLSFYVKPKGASPLPVEPVNAEKLAGWARETELETGHGIAAFDGQWKLVLISLGNANRVEPVLQEFHARGFAAKRMTVELDGLTLHRLVLPGFISLEAARNARSVVEAQLGIGDAWALQAN